MSISSYLEKLLDGVEVEWKALREVVKTVTAPAKLKREGYRETGKIPIIDQGEKFITGYTDEDVKALPFGEYVIFGDHSEHIKYVDFSFIQGADGLKILRSFSDNPKYVYYSFLNFYQKELKYKRHWARASETLIPIPCPNNPEKSLAIQAEIVRILDAFNAMTAELTAELNMRKKQYNYYRDQLLSFEEGEVEWKTLGTIATFSQGIQVDVQNQFPEKLEDFVRFLRIVDFVKNDEIPRYVKNPGQRYLKEFGELVMIRYGASAAGKVFLNHSGAIANNMFKINLTTDLITTKFLHAYLSLPSIYSNLNSNGGASTMPAITFGQIGALNIPIPPLEEQSRILAILDKFDALTNSISEGLPREIELRQKQYEYYRDLLLSFPASPAGGPKSHSDEAA